MPSYVTICQKSFLGGVLIMKRLSLLLLFLLFVSPVHAENSNYTQAWFYESSGNWQNVSVLQSGQGETYFVLYSSSGNETLICKVPGNFTGTRSELNEANPLMRISGRADVQLSPDTKNPSLYYKLAGDDQHLYRTPLASGTVTNPEVLDFSSAEGDFEINDFDIVDSDRIAAVSKEHNNSATVGLFEYPSGKAVKTWTCQLPSRSSSVENMFSVIFESSTGKIWVSVDDLDASVNVYYPRWHYSSLIDGNSTALEEFSPSEEIAAWNDDSYFKILQIGRYRRHVEYTQSDRPNIIISRIAAYDFDSSGKMQVSGYVDTWQTNSGTSAGVKDFWTLSASGAIRISASFVDLQNNLLLRAGAADGEISSPVYKGIRIVRFNTAGTAKIGQPESEEIPDEQKGTGVILITVPFSAPEGYKLTGSYWDIYKAEDVKDGIFEGKTPVYTGESPASTADRHDVNKELPDGEYIWRMYYKWQTGGGDNVMDGVTGWSDPKKLTVNANASEWDGSLGSLVDRLLGGDGGSGGSGGCTSGTFGLISALVLALKLRKK